MKIGGLQKTTALDYPGMVSAVVFTAGCNFRCPYCHNPELARGEGELLDQADVLAFLRKRRKVLDGVVLSGGEPTLQPGLAAFCAALKDMGYAVKLDSNGSRPEVLRELLDRKLLDYLALDVKADPRKYSEAISPAPLGDALLASITLARASGLPHEFRVTCVKPFVSPESMAAIAAAVQNSGLLFLQQARLDRVLSPEFFTGEGRGACTKQEIEALRQTALEHGADCRIR